jgi:hypothetical protein
MSVALNDVLDLDELRARLRKMSDAELLRFGKAANFMCSPKANLHRPPREAFVIQLREARDEYRRRNPIPAKSKCQPDEDRSCR